MVGPKDRDRFSPSMVADHPGASLTPTSSHADPGASTSTLRLLMPRWSMTADNPPLTSRCPTGIVLS
jgi:hypothetical protein